MFFGGGPPQRGAYQRRQRQRSSENGINALWLSYLPLIFLIVLSLFSSSALWRGDSRPRFAFGVSNEYSVHRSTAAMNIDYYLKAADAPTIRGLNSQDLRNVRVRGFFNPLVILV